MFKAAVAVVVFASVVGGVVSAPTDILSPPDFHAQKVFTDWSIEHGKVYPSATEFSKRFAVFQETLARVEARNADKSSTWTAGLNEYSDWTNEEFMTYFNLNDPQECSATYRNDYTRRTLATLDVEKDWRTEGKVTHVKNQGNCGSCWAFSTIGSMESHYAIKYDETRYFSEQQLVDCAGDFDNNGCHGGLPSHAFEYIRYNGLQEQRTYPYHARDQSCKVKDENLRVTASGSFNITEGDEEAMTAALAEVGPVSVAFQVVGDLRDYVDGVYRSDDCKAGSKDVNHAVLAVGYGTHEEQGAYYIIKNSWGHGWGNKGYFNIARGENMCGIATCSSFPEGVEKYGE